MTMNYVFDVDGTLTPSRMSMDKKFKDFFLSFIEKNKVHLVTGSDYQKTVQQVGKEICESVITCYNCSGNSVWRKGENVWNSDWKLPDYIKIWFVNELKMSRYPLRTGQHLEERPGLVNFSIVGRGASFDERTTYRHWDEDTNERRKIADRFNVQFGHEGIVAQVAGETGMDITPIGADKAQIAISIYQPMTFFGDKMDVGGNDFPLAQIIKNRKDSYSVKVKNWEDTYRYLTRLSYAFGDGEIKDYHMKVYKDE